MPLRIKELRFPVTKDNSDDSLKGYAAHHLGIKKSDIRNLRIVKKSLDARKKSSIQFVYRLDLTLDDEQSVLKKNQSKCDLAPAKAEIDLLDGIDLGKKLRHPPVIVGSGPAGIFAALVLAKANQPAIIIERGEPVETRLRTVNKLLRTGSFNNESNYCFGEGGAGTFSDGKLTCGRNHPWINYLFDTWVEFGAPEEILYEAHPHIGTDNLLLIAKNMRKYLESIGTTFLFNRRFIEFKKGGDARYQVVLDGGEEIPTDHLSLALGHSARDTYHRLLDLGLAMEPKPFAIGARLEHPQEVIDKIQFASCSVLPAAEYKLTAKVHDRGIWTFCMCPGGHLLPTGATEGHLAINGMSYHARNSGFANSAVVVNVRREDYFKDHILDGAYFQAAIEKNAFEAGGSNYFTPAQKLNDFLSGKESQGQLTSTYKPGVTPARLDKILPEFVVDSLKQALVSYDKKMRGFIADTAIVAGVETKTSSPVFMPRDKGTLQSISHPGIYPTGEGAGFSGGIVSSALDGAKVGRAILEDRNI